MINFAFLNIYLYYIFNKNLIDTYKLKTIDMRIKLLLINQISSLFNYNQPQINGSAFSVIY